MKVSIIGTGNVATQLAFGLESSGFTIDEVYGRNPNHLRQLVRKLYVAEPKQDLDFSLSRAEVLFMCVSDDAIETVAKQLHVPSTCVLVHTSGALPLQVLKPYHDRIGVFYPLQSISRTKNIEWDQVPIVLNAEDALTLNVLKNIAQKISKNSFTYTDEQRKALHLAAVFGSNFTNHLLKIVKDISDAEGLDFQIFKSLVTNTVQKAFEIGPEQGQTGPAIRNDLRTIRSHLKMLEGSQDLESIYDMITQHIIQTYK